MGMGQVQHRWRTGHNTRLEFRKEKPEKNGDHTGGLDNPNVYI